MTFVTIDLVYNKLLQMERDMHELRHSLVPMEKISNKEHTELDKIFAEMEGGKATPWRQAMKR